MRARNHRRRHPLFNEGKVVYAKGYGLRDKEKELPFTPDTVSTAASLANPLRLHAMQLVQEKLLDLDKPVYLYPPKTLADYPITRPRCRSPYKKITARMILTTPQDSPIGGWFQEDRKLSIISSPARVTPIPAKASPSAFVVEPSPASPCRSSSEAASSNARHDPLQHDPGKVSQRHRHSL